MLAIDVDTSVLGHALIAGAIAAAVAATAALAWRNKRPGVVGLPIALATLWVIRHDAGPKFAPLLIFAAAVIAFVAGELSARFEGPVFFYAPVAAGIVFAATPIPSVPVLARVFSAIAAVAFGIALSDFDRRHAVQGLGVLLLVITCCSGLFIQAGTVPGPALAGSAIFMLLLLLPKPFARVGAGGACAIAIAFWWSLLLTGDWPQGGDNLVAGAIACGFLLLEPAARAVLQHLSGVTNRRRSTRDAVWLVIVTAAAAQIALLVYASAVTARFDRLDLALLSAIPVVVIGGAVATEVVPSPRRQSRRRVPD